MVNLHMVQQVTLHISATLSTTMLIRCHQKQIPEFNGQNLPIQQGADVETHT